MAAPKTNDFYIRFNTDEFLAKTSWMPPIQLGIYIRLYAKYWSEKRTLSSDLTKLSRNCGFTEADRAELEFVLQEFFVLSEDGSSYHHSGLDLQAAENEAARAKNRENGRKGGLATQGKKRVDVQPGTIEDDEDF